MTICKEHKEYMATEPPTNGCSVCQKMYDDAEALDFAEQEYDNCYTLREALNIYEKCLQTGFEPFDDGYALKKAAREYLQKCAAKFQDKEPPQARDELG